MLNIQWGNGTFGATAGLKMYASDDGLAAADGGDGAEAKSGFGFSTSFGMEMGFGELGVGFSNSSYETRKLIVHIIWVIRKKNYLRNRVFKP